MDDLFLSWSEKMLGFREGAPYPYNIADMLLSEIRESKWKEFKEFELSGTSVLKMINERLSVREREIIELRWRDGKTYDECGKVFSVTRERIRQIEIKALRKLVYAARKFDDYISVPYSMYKELENKYNVMKSQKEQAELRLDKVLGIVGDNDKVVLTSKGYKTLPTNKDELPLTIDDMNLSVRAYNCLKRAGIQTLKDLVEADIEDYMKIRNLGKKSFDEIVSIVHSYGLLTKWEQEEI